MTDCINCKKATANRFFCSRECWSAHGDLFDKRERSTLINYEEWT